MTLNEKIKELRKSRNFSQQQLADMLGIHITHLSRIENGHNLPSLDVFKRLIDIFGVKPEYLLYDDVVDGELKINDKNLFEKLRLIDNLEEKDRQTLIHIIDTMITKQRMRELLAAAS